MHNKEQKGETRLVTRPPPPNVAQIQQCLTFWKPSGARRVQDANLAAHELLGVGHDCPVELAAEITRHGAVRAGEPNLGVRLEHQDAAGVEPRLGGCLARALEGVPAADDDLAGPVAQLPREVRGRVHGRAGRVDAAGGDDAVKEARQRRLPGRDDHDDVAAGAVPSDAVRAAQEVRKLPGEGARPRRGDAMGGIVRLGVQDGVCLGARIRMVCEFLQPANVSICPPGPNYRGPNSAPKRNVSKSTLGMSTGSWLL